jgi:hypothetical protein
MHIFAKLARTVCTKSKDTSQISVGHFLGIDDRYPGQTLIDPGEHKVETPKNGLRVAIRRCGSEYPREHEISKTHSIFASTDHR